MFKKNHKAGHCPIYIRKLCEREEIIIHTHVYFASLLAGRHSISLPPSAVLKSASYRAGSYTTMASFAGSASHNLENALAY